MDVGVPEYRAANGVLDDAASDQLLGGAGLDWFWAATNGLVKDTTDAMSGEHVNCVGCVQPGGKSILRAGSPDWRGSFASPRISFHESPCPRGPGPASSRPRLLRQYLDRYPCPRCVGSRGRRVRWALR